MSAENSSPKATRRTFITSATALGAISVAGSAFGQAPLDDNAKASRMAAAVSTRNPIFGPGALANLQQAVYDYEGIVANGGWPRVETTAKPKIGIWSAKDRIAQFRDDIYQVDGAHELALQTGLNQEPAVADN